MISDQDVNYIMNLSQGEKPEKRIREYLLELKSSRREKENRIEFFNKMNKAFFTYYFRGFAGRYTEECVMEAYTTALDRLTHNSLLEVALQDGIKSAVKLHRILRGYNETTEERIQY